MYNKTTFENCFSLHPTPVEKTYKIIIHVTMSETKI